MAHRPWARRDAALPAAMSINDKSQPPKMSPAGLVSAGMATMRMTGSAEGRASDIPGRLPRLASPVRARVL